MSAVDVVRRRWRGDYTVDAFGLDPELHDAAVRVGRMRWEVAVDGAEHVPPTGPALLVVQRRIGLSEQAVVAVGVGSVAGRRVRSAGVPLVSLVEAPLRRVGAALAHPAELTALLRDGHVVSIGLGWSPVHDDVGPLSSAVMTGPLGLGVPILPVAVRGREWGRRWRVAVGSPIDPGPTADATGGGPLAAVDAAELVRDEIRDLAESLREH